jgi:hypothetical protein
MTSVSFFVDPSCPWAWVTSRWVVEVAPHRDLDITWRSYCLEIRDDYDVAPTIPEEFLGRTVAAHALSHRMLRIFEKARTDVGEQAVAALHLEWGSRFFVSDRGDRLVQGDVSILGDCLAACGLDESVADAQDDERWDVPIVESMEEAYAFGGPKTQTPTIVIESGSGPRHGFKGPVMSRSPTGEAAVAMWDAIQVLSQEPGFFELTRPRAEVPTPPVRTPSGAGPGR